MNQELQAYLRNFVNFGQSDWKKWLPIAQLATNGRHHSAIGTSPFFATHGFETPSPIALQEDAVDFVPVPAELRAKAFVEKIHAVTELCQASMALANQDQEVSANKKRVPAPKFKVGDKVWLDLRNYGSERPKKKLDARHAKYTVSEVISPLSIRLGGITSGIHAVYHPDLLRLCADDPLPAQVIDDSQPAPVLLDNHQEFAVEEILCARGARRGKGREVLVKWYGYHTPNWEPLEEMEDVEPMDDFERKYGSARENDGPLAEYTGKKRKNPGRRARA